MGARCPSCGFDSADGALYCDFCKEPFLKRKKPGAPEALASAASASDPLLMLQADEDKIPRLPGWVRVAAWGLLALVLLSAALMAAMSLMSLSPKE
ncbi:MAG: hypothetical protein HY549_02765 [Elusimicrobia bacterium]|nr:hypothetical protein [Elusimicrobiota bacterium]